MSSLLSMDIGKKNIHIAEGSFVKNTVMVEKVATFNIPAGVFRGETIDNPSLLVEAITEAVHAFKFGSKEVILTIDAYGTMIRDIDLPMAKPKEIGAMIKNEMIQSYHIEPEDIIQYKSIDKITSENSAVLDRYRVAAINPEIIHAYHGILTEAKLKPVAMDININAMDKLLAGEVIINDKLPNEQGTMLIDFGDTLTTAYIHSKGKPIFFRQLDSGLGEIEKIISEKSFEAEQNIRIMQRDGFNLFGNSEEEEKYFSILRPFFYNLIDEIRKVVGFFSSRYSDGNVDQIYLFGGGSNLTGFAKYLENNFGIPTEQILSISKIKLKDPSVPIASYLNAIGALIRY